MRKGTSEEERNYACTERGEEGREEASGGARKQRREAEEQLREDRGGREIGREGIFKGGTLKDTCQYAIYSAQNYTQRGPCP